MNFLDILLVIAIFLFFLGTEKINKIGLVGAFLYCIYLIIKLLINFNVITIVGV